MAQSGIPAVFIRIVVDNTDEREIGVGCEDGHGSVHIHP